MHFYIFNNIVNYTFVPFVIHQYLIVLKLSKEKKKK